MKLTTKATLLATFTCLFLSCLSYGQPDVKVWVRGPWAYVAYEGRLWLIAPEASASMHSPPAVGHATGDQPLKANSQLDIDYVLPSSCQTCPTTIVSPPSLTIAKGDLDTLIHNRADRYVLSLPMPDSYDEAVSAESKISTQWWPACKTPCQPIKKGFTNQMVLHYHVSKLAGFSVDGHRLTFQDDETIIPVFMNPWGPMDNCDTGGRTAFYNLVQILKLQLYVDLQTSNGQVYPSDDDHEGCLSTDPQNPDGPEIVLPVTWPVNALGDYIQHPKPKSAPAAREAWDQIHSNRRLIADSRSGDPTEKLRTFDRTMQVLRDFLDNRERGKQLATTRPDAIKAFDDLRNIVIFNDGSGACRNPLLALTQQ